MISQGKRNMKHMQKLLTCQERITTVKLVRLLDTIRIVIKLLV